MLWIQRLIIGLLLLSEACWLRVVADCESSTLLSRSNPPELSPHKCKEAAAPRAVSDAVLGSAQNHKATEKGARDGMLQPARSMAPSNNDATSTRHRAEHMNASVDVIDDEPVQKFSAALPSEESKLVRDPLVQLQSLSTVSGFTLSASGKWLINSTELAIGVLANPTLSQSYIAQFLAFYKANGSLPQLPGLSVRGVLRDCIPSSSNMQDLEHVALAVFDLLDFAHAGADKVGFFIGPNYAAQAQVAAAIARGSRAPVFAMASGSSLTSKTLYPELLQMVADDTSQGQALASVFQHFGWRSVSILAYSSSEISDVIASFTFDAAAYGIKIGTLQTFSNTTDISASLAAVKAASSFIVLLAVTNMELSIVVRQCQAAGLLNPPYQMVGVWQFFRRTDLLISPTTAPYVRGMIGVSCINPKAARIAAIKQQWAAAAGRPDVTFNLPATSMIDQLTLYYDATVVALRAVNELARLERFCFQQPAVSQASAVSNITWPRFSAATERAFTAADCTGLLRDGESITLHSLALEQTLRDDESAAGPISFVSDGSGRRQPLFAIQHPRYTNTTTGAIEIPTIGFVDYVGTVTMLPNAGLIIWRSNTTTVPADTYVPVNFVFSKAGLVVGEFFSGLLAAANIVLLATVVHNREAPVIKASSAAFCVLILVGAFLIFSSAATLMVYPPTAATCQLAPLIGHTAFVIVISSLLVKTYRLVAIFNEKRVRVVVIKNRQLAIVVSVLTLSMLALVVAWLIFDRPTPTPVVIDLTIYTQCRSSNTNWQNAVLAFECTLLAFAGYFCVRSRSTPSLFNESLQLAISIYNVIVIGGVVLVLSAALNQRPDVVVGIQVAAILAVSAFVLAILYGPKLVLVYLGQSGQSVTTDVHVADSNICTTEPKNNKTEQQTVIASTGPIPAPGQAIGSCQNTSIKKVSAVAPTGPNHRGSSFLLPRGPEDLTARNRSGSSSSSNVPLAPVTARCVTGSLTSGVLSGPTSPPMGAGSVKLSVTLHGGVPSTPTDVSLRKSSEPFALAAANSIGSPDVGQPASRTHAQSTAGASSSGASPQPAVANSHPTITAALEFTRLRTESDQQAAVQMGTTDPAARGSQLHSTRSPSCDMSTRSSAYRT